MRLPKLLPAVLSNFCRQRGWDWQRKHFAFPSDAWHCMRAGSWRCSSSINSDGDSSVPPGYWIINYHRHMPCLFQHTFLESFFEVENGNFSGMCRCSMTLLELPTSRNRGQADITGKKCLGLTYLHSKSCASDFSTAN